MVGSPGLEPGSVVFQTTASDHLKLRTQFGGGYRIRTYKREVNGLQPSELAILLKTSKTGSGCRN